MLDVDLADKLMHHLLMQWDDGDLWWRRFLKRRNNWENNKQKIYGGSRTDTWQMVDHGWDHAEGLYCLLPRFIWAISFFLPKDTALFQNAAEVYTFMVSAYLHDIGMSFPTIRLEEVRQDLQSNDFFFSTDDLYKWMNESLNIHIKAKERLKRKQDREILDNLVLFSDARAIRKLHPELGAWLCNSERILADEEERKTIAQVIFRHAKRVPKFPNEGHFRLELEGGEPQDVRVGVIAFLIALADACAMGHERVKEVENHLHGIRSEIAKCRVMLQALRRKAAFKDVYDSITDEMNLLQDQPKHLLKHRAIRHVAMGPKGFIIVPDVEEGSMKERFSFQYTQLSEFGSVCCFSDLVKDACNDVKGEIIEDGLLSPEPIFEIVKTIPIPVITAAAWQDEWREKASENDTLWQQHVEQIEMACATETSLSERQRTAIQTNAGIQSGSTDGRDWKTYLKPSDFTAYLTEKRRLFCGREWLFGEINDWCGKKGERALLIKGDPGAGKSAVVAELIHRNPEGRVLAYHCCQADDIDTLSPGGFVRSIAAMIASRIDGYAEQLAEPEITEALSKDYTEQNPAGAFEKGILNPLAKMPAPESIRYILVDALDEALTRQGPGITIVDLLSARIERLPAWLRVIATTRREPDVLNRLGGLRATELDAQDPRNLDDIKEYIKFRLMEDALAVRLAASRVTTEKAVDTLCEKAAGNFLYVKEVLEGIARDAYEFSRLDALPPGLEGLYQKFFERHFPDDATYAPAKRLLQVIVAACEPLTEDLLAAATGLDPEDDLPSVLRTLAAYLPERHGVYTVYHKSFADWLSSPKNRGTRFFASPKKGAQALAKAGWQRYRDEGPEKLSAYFLRHLPKHLITAERWDDIEILLTDLFFLEKKIKMGMAFELINDFKQSTSVLPHNRPLSCILILLEEALCRDINFIERHMINYPQALLQCLWNSCWWYDCPEALQYYYSESESADIQPWGHNNDYDCDKEQPELSKNIKIHILLERWRRERVQHYGPFPWIRSLRPPIVHLGTALKMTFQAPSGQVLSLAFSHDGTRVACLYGKCLDGENDGENDHSLRIWDIATNRCLQNIPLDPLDDFHDISRLSFSRDDTRIIGLGSCSKIVVWNVESGACLHDIHFSGILPGGQIFRFNNTHILVIHCIISGADSGTCLKILKKEIYITDALNDNSKIGDACHDKSPWWIIKKAYLHTDKDSFGYIPNKGISPVGTHIIDILDETLRVWDIESGICLNILKGHTDKICCVAFSPDGTRIASASLDKTIRVWDTATGACLNILLGNANDIVDIAFSPDGIFLITGSNDSTICLWDTTIISPLRTPKGNIYSAKNLTYSPNGTCIVSGSLDGTICVWDSTNGICSKILKKHNCEVVHVAFSPNGCYLASKSVDNTICVWDIVSGDCKQTFEKITEDVADISFTPDGHHVIITHNNKNVRFYNFCRDTLHAIDMENILYPSEYIDICRDITKSDSDGNIRLWNREINIYLNKLACNDKFYDEKLAGPFTNWKSNIQFNPYILAFSSDGVHIASGHNNLIFIWDIKRSTCQKILVNKGSQDGAINVWDAINWNCLDINNSHTEQITSVSFSPDGKYIVGGSKDGTISVWDVTNWKCLHVINSHTEQITSVSFSPDGKYIVSGAGGRKGKDFSLRIWDKVSGICLHTLIGHASPIRSIKFSSDRTRVISESQDGVVCIWDMSNGLRCEGNITSAPLNSSFRVFVIGNETIIEDVDSGVTVARLPLEIKCINFLGNDLTWAGCASNCTYLFRLELENEIRSNR